MESFPREQSPAREIVTQSGEAAGSAVSSDAAAGSASLAATAISADFPTDRNRTAVHMMAIIFFRIFGFVFIIRTILFL